ncbi:MAG: excinuclease ABC subunit UvrA [Chthoniobacterales bacterium]
MTKQRSIRIRGARHNNLTGFDLDLPVGELIVVTGPSGSGKSSLAFDTIYAEGQRRYVETFSPYTRQFFDRMDKPQVDLIEGIPPAIAIEQSNHVKSTRSTVGTITEINDYLKLLMPRVAEAQCPNCQRPIAPEHSQSICKRALKELNGKKILITFPLDVPESTRKKPVDFFSFLQSQGYLRILFYGEIVRTDEPTKRRSLPERIEVIHDRITCDKKNQGRLQEAIETALRLGKGKINLVETEATPPTFHPASQGWHCAHCDIDIRPPSPGLFSFNNPLGACPSCRGFGRSIGIDYMRALPDRSLSIADGVVRPFQTGFSQECQRDLLRHAYERDIDIDVPFEKLSKKEQDFIINGEGTPAASTEEIWRDNLWYGVKGYFEWLESRAYKMHVRVLLSRYRSYRRCEDCNGGRFQPETLNFRLPTAKGPGLTLPEIAALPVRDLLPLIEKFPAEKNDPSVTLLREQIHSRLSYLDQVGLSYLSLDRPTRSLSGGEIERVNLTSCLGASLVNTLFVMDEPSVGLHPRDTARLVEILQRLREKGNTLMVVEHEESIIRAADYLVDIGPGRGSGGGNLVFSGPAHELTNVKDSLTRDYLYGQKSIPIPKKRRKSKEALHLRGINHHNLKKLDLDIPLGIFCCVTGVSGSGKSSLVHDVIYRNLDLNPSKESIAPGFVHSLYGAEDIEEVVMVDQSPLSRTPRSTPALYLGVFDKIRELFSFESAAVKEGFTPSFFSFNSGKGRCERCSGLGFEKVEMQFLSDLFLRCPECEGKRFREEVLKIKLDGKSIHEVLEMTVAEAIDFFAKKEKKGEITGPLKLLREVGLEYLLLGQPVNVLSGGEAQRLKLIKRMVERKSGKETLIIFDEPTTGLHFDDIRLLLAVFQRLVKEGISIIVIEHNLDVIKSADWIIDLGPEAGDQGGQIVAQGTPEQISRVKKSHTGQHLQKIHNPAATPTPAPRRKKTTSLDAGLIRVQGAREHNLKNINVEIPREKMVVVTGLSGSGKSTLAFDILFAEGQRRFLDSMSPYARQFAEQLEKPDIDHIDGLPPTVAIEQRVTRGGGKSTVATVTEAYHFLRLLFAKLGTQHCPECKVPVTAGTIASAQKRADELLKHGKVQVFAPLIRGRKGYHTEVATWAERHGFNFLLVDGELKPVQGFQKLERYKEHTIDVLTGQASESEADELPAYVKRALEVGKGTARLLDGKGNFHIISTEMNCPSCGDAFDKLDPRLFSFNSPHGWCTHCRGFGEVWELPKSADHNSIAEAEIDEERRYEKLAAGEATRCPICKGQRLNETARSVYLQDHSISDIVSSSARSARELIQDLKFKGNDLTIARDIVQEITQRLSFLEKVGLEYLELNRSSKTLSGGESQRIRLASQLGSNLCGVLYVLDEPTIGLHPRDNEKLLDSLQLLAQKGNSLLIVEHDESTMRRADSIIDLGPRAGNLGGEIIAQGTMDKILKHPTSLTSKHLRDPMSHPLPGKRRSLKNTGWIELKGATRHNLKSVDCKIPLGRLTAITGVSGSGKSTLIRGVLVPAIKQNLKRNRTAFKPIPTWKEITGVENLAAVLEVDQSPIGKTPRSTPATYVKLFDHIRKLFAQLPEARVRGYTLSRFSFNNEGGRCETCQGQGIIKLEMNFLPTSYMPCEECKGRRFNAQTEEILYNGKSIGQILQMTIAQACEFFSQIPKIHRSLSLLNETGLGYLQLGQPSPTLSGGEAQRIKLVAELASRATSHQAKIRTGRSDRSTLYLLEEPTIGLHAADVTQLTQVLHRLVDEGGTVVIIEHHTDLIAEADYVIDIGPEAGERGGNIVATGTPEEIAKNKKSHTGKFLKDCLKK